MCCCTEAVKKEGKTASRVAVVNAGDYKVLYFTFNFEAGTENQAEQVAAALKKYDASGVWMFVSGGKEKADAFYSVDSSLRIPAVWIQGDKCDDSFITSVQIIAVVDKTVEYMVDETGIVNGAMFEDDNASYCYLGNLYASDNSLSRTEQSAELFPLIDTLLQKVGMDFSNVARTWLYLDDLLTWYDDFNPVRTDYFNANGVFDNLVPASTGIGAGNPADMAILVGALGVKVKNSAVNIAEVPSPLQCAAWDYKSSFSRATEVTNPAWNQVMVSGTASIEPEGATVHLNDSEKQIELTMKVIEAILNERDMTFKDTVRAIAYIKDAADLKLLKTWMKKNDLEDMPVAFSHADVCRDNLLFEVELDAVKGAESFSL